ncbi:MAG: SGNH/GDSL hydrolase family protein [Candidatus Microsaccharimonas sp.]
MARLPQPGSDAGQWGDILNEYLSVSLNEDGALKTDTVGATQLKPGAVINTAIANATIEEDKLSSSVQAKLNTQRSSAVSSVAGKTGVVTLAKNDVGLNNVDNTSDVNKPISTATQIALDSKAVVSHTHTAANISDATTIGRNVLTATDAAAARVVIGAGTSNLTIGNTSTTAKAGDYTPTKSDVGLNNVDNTSDLNKPISTATQTALNAKLDASQKAASSGVASLDTNGKLPEAQVPDRLTASQLSNTIASAIASSDTSLNARSIDALVSALDMRDPRSVVIGAVGDSTADFSDEWFETAFREMFASQWPDRPARLKRWNRTENQYPATFTTWQTAETPGAPSDPGGTFPDTIIASDGFARTGALVGSSMDVGTSAYTGTANILSTDGDRLITNASGTAIVAAGMKTRNSADFSAKVTIHVTSKAAANRQVKWYAVRKDTSNDLEIAYSGSTTITLTLVKRIAGTATVLYTWPAGTIPSNTDPADYLFEMVLSGTTLTAKVNGVAATSQTLTTDEVTAVAGMTLTGFSSPSESTWSVDNLEVRGTVVVPPSGGSSSTPSPLGYATVYNGAIAGSTIESQRIRLPQIMPERPDLIVITHGHNYGTETADTFIAAINAFLTDLFTLYDNKISVAVMSENPRFTNDASEAAHRNRQIALRAYTRQRGWLYLPGFEAYSRLTDGGKSYVNSSDGVHPNPVGTNPSGARLQADAAKRRILAISERYTP